MPRGQSPYPYRSGPSPQVRRRRTAVLLALAAVAAAIMVLIGRASPAHPIRRTDPTLPKGPSATSPSSVAASTTTSTTVPAPSAPFPVGSTTVAVDDQGRQFTTAVFYPALQAGTGATPLRRGGPWPLIVFSPGFDIDPGRYTGLVQQWARAGFVVAVADYPLTAPNWPGGVNESDIVHHPADLQAVIDQMLALSSDPQSLLDGTIDPSRIGAAGHSDGGDVTDAVVANSLYKDPRIKAAAILSGAELTSFGGTYGPPGVPLLVVQGDADQINPAGCSQLIYDQAGSPRYYLDLHGAGHMAPYLDTGPYDASALPPAEYQATVDRETVLFWQGYLGGDTAALSSLATNTAPGPDATLTAGAPVPETGYCPPVNRG